VYRGVFLLKKVKTMVSNQLSALSYQLLACCLMLFTFFKKIENIKW